MEHNRPQKQIHYIMFIEFETKALYNSMGKVQYSIQGLENRTKTQQENHMKLDHS